MSEIVLRPYQEKLIGAVHDSWKKGHKHVIMQGSTGMGKTVCFSYIVKKTLERENTALILTHRQELMNQTSGALFKFHLNPQLIDARTREIPKGNCFVCMTNSLRNRMRNKKWIKWYDSISEIIIDECHMQDFNWIFGLPETKQKYVIGVTATPNRTGNQRELANDYDDMVFGPDVQEMINLGYLCPDRTYSVPIDMKGVRKKGGDYDTEQMYERYNKGELYSGVISNWKKICPDTITLCFCVNIQHCINTCIAFNNAGIKAKFITSQPQKPKLTSNNKGDISLFMLKKHEYENYLSNFAKYSGKREEVISSWEQGDFPVLINAGIATTGFDFPPIETIILDRATTSDNLLLQMEGRGARIYDGKDYFNILDFGDNTSRLGFYRQQRDYSLYKEASRSGTGAPPVKECPKCHALVFSSSKVCKYCGYVFPQTHDEKVVELKEVAYREAVTKLDTPHDCELYAQAKGYKKNWVFRQIYIKWGLEGLQDYAKQRGLSPTWPYVIQARYSAQGIRNK